MEMECSRFEEVCKITENRERGLFTVAGQTVQRQYAAEEQLRGKNKFINRTLHQHPKPPISIRALQYSTTRSELV